MMPHPIDPTDDLPLDGALGAAVESLRAPVPVSADFDARVMAAVRAAPRPGRSGLWGRLVRPRTVRWSPLLAAASVAIVFLAGRWSVRSDAALPAGAGTVEIRFVHETSTANAVHLVGDFNGWNPTATPLRRTADGIWVASVALPAGVHQYAFVIDGQTWESDPKAARAPGDDFGRPNSQVVVGSS